MTLARPNPIRSMHRRRSHAGGGVTARVLASLWAAALLAAGLGLLLQCDAATGWVAGLLDAPADSWRSIVFAWGILLLAGGEFVLMALVADPLFPLANPAVRRRLEAVPAGLVLLALLWIAWSVAKMVAG
ncbi:MAG: hypothetical protein NTW19_10525 [Planctomycetota bacterium]|nr:hypothetical protein [Planctomycetota bacterium]